MPDGDAHLPRVVPATSRPPRAVPIVLTRLIGRERELAAVRQTLLEPHVRLLTLVGPPGIGKTRLGLAVADQLAVEASVGIGPASIADVLFVPLAPLRETGTGRLGDRTRPRDRRSWSPAGRGRREGDAP